MAREIPAFKGHLFCFVDGVSTINLGFIPNFTRHPENGRKGRGHVIAVNDFSCSNAFVAFLIRQM